MSAKAKARVLGVQLRQHRFSLLRRRRDGRCDCVGVVNPATCRLCEADWHIYEVLRRQPKNALVMGDLIGDVALRVSEKHLMSPNFAYGYAKAMVGAAVLRTPEIRLVHIYPASGVVSPLSDKQIVDVLLREDRLGHMQSLNALADAAMRHP